MTKFKKLQHQGADIYPVTHEEAVLDSDGVSVGEKINNIEMDRIKVLNFNGDMNTNIEFNNNIAMGYEYIVTNDNDDSDNIQAALDEGLNIIIKGDIYTNKKIIVSNNNQHIIQEYGTWYVKHNDDDAIEVLGYNVKIKANFSGVLQDENTNNISCIVVGQGGTEAAEKGRNCDLTGTNIKYYQGNGIRWRNGARINLSYVEILECNGHGFVSGIGCKDNNDGLFNNMTVTYCNGTGVYLKAYNAEDISSDVVVDGAFVSSNHTFINTKCFGNNINFVIGTNHNTGTIFSESGKEFDVISGSKNTLKYMGDITSSNNFVNTGENEIEYEDSFHHITRNNLRSERMTIGDQYSGSMSFYQSGNDSFTDIISDTNGMVEVHHDKGSASLRTDIFDKIVIGNCSMRCIKSEKASFSEEIRIPAMSWTKYEGLPSVAVPYNAVVKTFFQFNYSTALIVSVSGIRYDSGWYTPVISFYNPTSTDVVITSDRTFDMSIFY